MSVKKKPGPPEPIPDEMKKRAGVFVCLKKNNALRGCIGTVEPGRENLAQEIIDNAIAASTADSRFGPVTEDELDSLEITVDVLSPPEEVGDVGELDPTVYGLIVTAGLKRGLLLPAIDGVDSVERQLAICRKKGKIGPDEEVSLQRFTVTRYR